MRKTIVFLTLAIGSGCYNMHPAAYQPEASDEIVIEQILPAQPGQPKTTTTKRTVKKKPCPVCPTCEKEK